MKWTWAVDGFERGAGDRLFTASGVVHGLPGVVETAPAAVAYLTRAAEGFWESLDPDRPFTLTVTPRET